jgi:hypothetical protein
VTWPAFRRSWPGHQPLAEEAFRKAYVEYEIDGDGDAWSTLYVVDRDGHARQLGRWDSFPDRRSFRAVAKSHRWAGSGALQFVPWASELPLPDGWPPLEVMVETTR